VNHKGFLKFTFRPIYWPDEKKERVLFIGRPGDFPTGVKIIKTIRFLNSETAVQIVEG